MTVATETGATQPGATETPGTDPALLEVRQLTRRFGGVLAVQDVSFDVPAAGIVGLIGPNGAGKSTVVSMLGGQLRPSGGRILLSGRRVDGLSADRLHALGIARVFQTPRPFRRLTVLENLLLGCPANRSEAIGGGLWRRRRIAAHERQTTARARALLGELGLDLHRDRPAGELSGGQHKLLDLARALMARPLAILLDEPCSGLHPSMIAFLAGTVRRLRAAGTSFVVVEHNIGFVLDLCDRLVVLAQGQVVAQGAPEQVRRDRRVIDAFLGQPGG
jgi:branched-chain amino acid transport system ATP-binding protein